MADSGRRRDRIRFAVASSFAPDVELLPKRYENVLLFIDLQQAQKSFLAFQWVEFAPIF
jgi:hypothetical protein